MPDILSQGEIDALLAALSSGEMDAEQLKEEEHEKKIKNYDFKRALRFSKDQIRSLTRVYENYARLLTTYFSAQLRTFVQISVASVDQVPYEEFIRSIPTMTILNVFRANPLEGRMVMEVNPNIAYSMLERMLGGKGVNQPDSSSSLTEIETIVMKRIFSRALDSFQEAWKSIIPLDPELEILEENPQFMQIASPNETVAVISLSAEIGDVTGMLNFCIPHVVLEPIIPKLSAHFWFSTQKKSENPEDIASLQKRVKQTELSIVAELGYSEIQIGEFLQLQVGDVIRLREMLEDPVVIRIGDKPKYYAQPGVYKGKSAVQIVDVVGEEENENG